jgi:thermitase
MKRALGFFLVLLCMGFNSCNERKQLIQAPKVDMDPTWIEMADLGIMGVQPPIQLPGPGGEFPEDVEPKDPDPDIIPIPMPTLPDTDTLGVEDAGDPLLKMQWNMKKVKAENIWGKTKGSRAVKVMLIGTGINYNHPDLKENIAINRTEYASQNPLTGLPENGIDDDGNGLIDDFVGWDFVDEDGMAFDHFGFDTYAAGVIGAAHNNGIGVRGIAEQVSLYPVRYINANGMSSFPILVQALQHILDVNPHVVLLNLLNLEIGRRGSVIGEVEVRLIERIMKDILKRGIPIIVGAGNVSLEVTSEMKLLHAMAEYDNVFVVSNSDRKDEKAYLANYSHRFVQTFAPGEQILSTSPNGKWGIVSGTYFAAAHVAGAMALAISTHGGNRSYEEIFNALRSTAGSSEVTALSRYSVGRNRLDVSKFLSALE